MAAPGGTSKLADSPSSLGRRFSGVLSLRVRCSLRQLRLCPKTVGASHGWTGSGRVAAVG